MMDKSHVEITCRAQFNFLPEFNIGRVLLETEPPNIRKFHYDDFVSYTDNFSAPTISAVSNLASSIEEMVLLRHEMVINHLGMVKLYAYCWDSEHLGVAYEFKPFDSGFNLIPKDDFTWPRRIKLALDWRPFSDFCMLDTLHFTNRSHFESRCCSYSS
ncbi:hypothetical protein PHJA_000104700 [Phtheirospermum japonicum]|uniref:Uncharacterized protein n=1 Tax=Phtheirospermum japonicum TaxID=374723 RepID=A0A830B290_9LAMI|nr:hypothetical protein PHJA_000104700 [Phtheirospermum japonicum]